MRIRTRAFRFARALPVLALAACGSEPTSSAVRTAEGVQTGEAQAVAPAGVRAAIEANNARLIAAFVAGDAAAAAALFADDAVLLLPGVPTLSGRATIEQALAGAFGAVTYRSIVANIEEVQYFGDYALERGNSVFTYEAGGQTFVDQGKYIVAWTRGADGTWLIHRDVSNVTSSQVQ
jgi:uncharacterized protein (TIGR02246 family)